MPEITETALDSALGPRLGGNAGQPMTRRDGIAKVTGAAKFSADNRPAGMLHAALAVSTIAHGEIVSLNVAAAEAHPGVIAVWTPETRPALAGDPDEKPGRFDFRVDVLQSMRIRYAGQPIALVIARSLEAASEGARLLAPAYDAQPPVIGFDGEEFVNETTGIGAAPSFAKGDMEAGLAEAAQVVETAVETPDQYHNAMEPHGIVAAWEGERLILDMPNQAPVMARPALARFFGMDPEKILIRTPYLGGGFGSKAAVTGPFVLAILAAKEFGAPVRLVLSRAQMYGPTGHRGATRQDLRLGLDHAGKLTALAHHARSVSSTHDDFFEGAAGASKNLYAAPAISTSHTGARAHKGTPMAMRAPGEASGLAALEIAVDDAAIAAGIDPLAFRLRNYAEVDPATGLPFTSKALRECYAQGAAAFGWEKRPLGPRSMRDGAGRLIGWGMGTAQFPALVFPGAATASIRADGTGMAATSGIDMGQGAWTALAQLAADGLGLDVDDVEFRSGASDLPDAGVAGGSAHTATAGSALHAAGRDAVGKLAEIAMEDPDSPLFGAGNSGWTAARGRIARADDPSRSESYAEILARAGLPEVTGAGTAGRDPSFGERFAAFAHGAVFAEVAVDPDLGQVLVTRMVGAFAAGRIVNPKLARSQLEGGMIWGLSFALHEEAVHDPVTGRLLNADLAGYHVPVHADVPPMQAIMVDEHDPHVNALGVKGVGELAITGAVGAIANAVRHATGVRVGRYPIRLETLAGLG